MENKDLMTPEPEAKATALPKRKAEEPYLIPWEDGEPFKCSKEYILQFYKGRKNVKDSIFSGRFNDFYAFDEYSVSVREKGDEKYTLYLSLSKTHLSIRCSCAKQAEGLCEHAAAVFYDKIPSHKPFYFKGLYNEDLLSLSQKFRSMLSIKLEANWNSLELQLQNNSTFGRIYNFSITERYDQEAWSYRASSYRGMDFPAAKFEEVAFLVVTDGLYCGLPYVLPYMEKNKQGRNLSKSYLFYEGEEPELLSPHDLFKERICKKMLEIADDDNYQINGITLDGDSNRNNHSKALGILGEWRTLIASLQNNETLCFTELWGHTYSPYRAKLKNTYRKKDIPVSLSNGDVKLQITLEDNPSYLRLTFNISYKEEPIENPQFMSDDHCFFMIAEENRVVFVDDLDLEKVIREARKSDFILTVFGHDRGKFLEESLIPLSQRYAMQVVLKGKRANLIVQAKKPKRIVDIDVTNETLVVRASVCYNRFGEHPLAPFANMLVKTNEDGQYVYAQRHAEIEQAFYAFLQQQHKAWSEQQHEIMFSLPMDKIDHTQWLSLFCERCKQEGIELQMDTVQQGSSYYPHPLHWEVKNVHFQDNKCRILFAPKFRNKVIPLADFENMITKATTVYDLGKNQYGVIRSSDIALFRPIFLSAEIDGDYIILNSLQMLSFQTILEKIDSKIVNDTIRERRERLARLEEIPQLAVPSTVQATLRPYQIAGFSWMSFLNEFQWGGLLADDMGLGKTLQVITLLEHYYQVHPLASASLVVVPNSLLFNWQNEYQKFAPNRETVVYYGITRQDMTDFDTGVAVLTTYGTLLSDSDFFAEKSFSYLIMDESQNVKNRNSKRFESLSRVNAQYRIAMTGTPIENGIQDIYSQMSLVNPGFFGNYRAFNKLYKGGTDADTMNETLSNLQKVIQPFILRRTKKQVALDLPEKTETILYMDMPPAQHKVYEKYRKLFQGEVKRSLESEYSGKSKFIAIEALIKLRQICNSPNLLKGETFDKNAVKLDYIDEILDDVTPDHKVLLFSSFTGMLQLVAERIEGRGIEFAYLDGKMSQDKRQNAVQTFQEKESCRVFLISLKAGGTGLNLTAADYVYILDPWWNPAAEAQAIDRCYRIGQDKHVNAYKIVCRDSVEEKILALQEHKKKLADGLILDETNIMKSLSKDELLKLFE
ncbi:DEAD/DEAH box helicase [Sphingobacterium chuzhouense]|uniref:DEAD/DEAH box helicase n=1 Tax=Sphingobacterium chuzhouense TaxID=1742264 RepID=A0ABR7XXT8_9SPHI|nr:DEAD/DEAH box helicase [Sphingobacterium chuzhouense]MBD1423879.1 DEAD/DEAH box helicase [Sphingobacterium chuzhouense]